MNLILAGGGNSDQSRMVDNFFKTKFTIRKILFLPQAISPEIWTFERAYEWIRKNPIFIDAEISYWDTLNNKKLDDVLEYDAIYIMGGNTFKLLNELRISNFIPVISEYINRNRPIYGISAGAIIFGQNITPASIGPEKDENYLNLLDLSGLAFLKNILIYTHYNEEVNSEIRDLASKYECKIICIPEDSGLYVHGNHFKVLGFGDVQVYDQGIKRQYKMGELFIL